MVQEAAANCDVFAKMEVFVLADRHTGSPAFEPARLRFRRGDASGSVSLEYHWFSTGKATGEPAVDSFNRSLAGKNLAFSVGSENLGSIQIAQHGVSSEIPLIARAASLGEEAAPSGAKAVPALSRLGNRATTNGTCVFIPRIPVIRCHARRSPYSPPTVSFRCWLHTR
jgi:hypothetical protein